MPGLRLLVSMPGSTCRRTLLIGRQPVHPIPDQYAMDCGTRHVHVVKTMKVAGDSSRPEPIAFSQVQDLRDNHSRSDVGRVRWSSWPIAQACLTVTFIPGLPFVEGFAREAEVPAGLRNASRHLIGSPQ